MSYKGVGDNTKIHYSNKNLHWNPICNHSVCYRHSDNWSLVTCKNCLKHFDRLFQKEV